MSLLTFRFRHSRADDLPWLIELTKRGAFRQQALSPKQIVYETTFDLADPLHLPVALSLATALVHDKKAEAFVSGQALGMPMVREVLRCYQRSQQVEDHHAYCWFQTGFTLEQKILEFTLGGMPSKPFIFPCHLAANRVARLTSAESRLTGRSNGSCAVARGSPLVSTAR